MITTNSQILKAARRHIANHATDFICYAIRYSNVGTRSQRDALQDGIALILQGCPTYNNWIFRNHPALLKGIRNDKYREHFRDARLAWLDSMIAEELAREAA